MSSSVGPKLSSSVMSGLVGLIERACVDDAAVRGEQRFEAGIGKRRDHRREIGDAFAAAATSGW